MKSAMTQLESAPPAHKSGSPSFGAGKGHGDVGQTPPGQEGPCQSDASCPGVSGQSHGKSPDEMRAAILRLEAAIKASPDIQVHIEPKHYFAPGIYMREITIPKGVTLTGKIHKTEHLCILSQGEVSVWTDQGLKRLKASTVVHSMPGIKRVLYAHEDSVWINVHHHPTNEKDPAKIEEIFVVDTFDQFLAFRQMKELEEKS